MHMGCPCPGPINGIPGQACVGIRSVVQVDEQSKSVTIGFSRSEDAGKAYYHVVSGAGKSRTIRDFLGLTDAEMEQVADVIARGIRFEFLRKPRLPQVHPPSQYPGREDTSPQDYQVGSPTLSSHHN